MDKIKLQNYPLVCPTPVVLIGALVGERPNYATVGAYGLVCQEPVLYISLKSTHHTTKGVRANRYFSVNVPTAAMVRQTDYCGKVSGADHDKSQLFTAFYDERGKAPLIGECPLNFLCEVVQTVPFRGFEIFLGEVVATYANESCAREAKFDPSAVDPLFLMGASYFGIGSRAGTVFASAGLAREPRNDG